MLLKRCREFNELVVAHGQLVLGIMRDINDEEILNEDSRKLMDELMCHSMNLNSTIGNLERQMKRLKQKELDNQIKKV